MKIENLKNIVMAGDYGYMRDTYLRDNSRLRIFTSHGLDAIDFKYYYIRIQSDKSKYIYRGDPEINNASRFVARIEPCILEEFINKDRYGDKLYKVLAISRSANKIINRGCIPIKYLNKFISIDKGRADFYEGSYSIDYAGVFSSIDEYNNALKYIYN
jgi:hypothetical protein